MFNSIINNVVVLKKSQTQQPRGIVVINGIRVAWIDIEVNNNAYHQADSFRVTVPVTNNQPKEITREWWNAQNPMCVEIYMGFPSDPDNYDINDPNMKLMIVGNVDEFPHDLVNDTISLTGRDYSSLMIETKIVVNTAENRTASKMIKSIADSYGLGTSHIQENKKLMGTLYKNAFTKMNRNTTEWDLVSFIAKETGWQVYINGTDLYFEPKPANPPIYPLVWSDSDRDNIKSFWGKTFVVTRNLTLAKNIKVMVRVLNVKTGTAFTVPIEATHTKDKVLNRGKRYIGTPQVYFEHIDQRMTRDEAIAKGYEILENISRHQMKLVCDGIPGDTILSPHHIIRLIGTSDYDQDYQSDQIIRTMSMERGFVMDITAKNHDVNTVMPV